MTSNIENKIIIDGVDVSKCKYYHCKGCTANNFGKSDSSSEIYKNCYFKQLKRTELAFENLKRRGTIPMVSFINKGGQTISTCAEHFQAPKSKIREALKLYDIINEND